VADTWLPLAHRLLQAAGYEATLTEAAYALELTARLVAAPISTVVGAARRHPLAALGIGAVIALVAYQGRVPRARPAAGSGPDHLPDQRHKRGVSQRSSRVPWQTSAEP
jgi:hypothetical protein